MIVSVPHRRHIVHVGGTDRVRGVRPFSDEPRSNGGSEAGTTAHSCWRASVGYVSVLRGLGVLLWSYANFGGSTPEERSTAAI